MTDKRPFKKMHDWRKWAEKHNLGYNPETGDIRKMKDDNVADTAHYWIRSDFPSPDYDEKIWKKVRANVLRRMDR